MICFRRIGDLILTEDGDTVLSEQCGGNTGSGDGFPDEPTVVNLGAAAGRTEIGKNGGPDIVKAAHLQRQEGAFDKLFGYIPAGFVHHPGGSGQDCFSSARTLNFSRGAGNREAAGHFRAECHEPILLFPACKPAVRKGLDLPVIPDRFSEEAGADQDFLHSLQVDELVKN